ncbi:beta-glucosidase-related glycosidase [Geopyxis carbonaria]|nr:beta-glucosidase-related glycosidase [Geopyxis carbonaria]
MKTAVLTGALAAVAAAASTSPPYYPTPKGGWVADWSASYEKARALVAQMTLAEKVNITTGIGWQMGRCVGNTGPVTRLGFPSLCAQDGPLGVRNADYITAFPAGITAGATWDEELIYARGLAIGEEARAKGVHVILGPSVGPLGRSPLGGRNWEGFGADAYLQGRAARQGVAGIQAAGTQACIKHFIGNEQEHFRGDGGVAATISSELDDRTLHEAYLWPFAEAVRAGAASAMCAYNMVNGSYACQNSALLNGVLKDELGFQGYVMADWLAQRSGVGAMLAGLDMTMPGDGAAWADGASFWGPQLTRAVLNSSVPVPRLNDAVTRIVAAWYQTGQDAADFPPLSFSAWTTADTDVAFRGAGAGPTVRVNSHTDVRGAHGATALAVARDGIVLLKNTNATLPLSAAAVLRIFGSGAGANAAGANSCADRGCNSGVLGMGWGSGTADYYPDIATPLAAIAARAANTQSQLADSVSAGTTTLASTPGAQCLVFITSDSGEGYITVEGHAGDRNALSAWHNGDALIAAVARACAATIVVLHAVGPVLVEPWIDHPNVTAVLHAHLPGRDAGPALAQVLFGDVSPSGRLPYTMGRALADWNTSLVTSSAISSGPIPQPFAEGVFIDYKHFDRAAIAPRFEFGFGLAYTTFAISGASLAAGVTPSLLPPARPAKGATPSYPTAIPAASEAAWPAAIVTRVAKYVYPYLDSPAAVTPGVYPYPAGYSTTEKPAPAAGGAQGGNAALWDVVWTVRVTVTNTGGVAAKAVPQLYIQFPDDTGVQTPVRQLRGFKKVLVPAGGKVEVEFEVTRKDLSIWDVVRQNWVIPGAGAKGHVLHVGQSSRRLEVSCFTATGVCGAFVNGTEV